ncbi:MAG: RsmD family RNA methyltransferase [Verrucomicrobiota bacterium]
MPRGPGQLRVVAGSAGGLRLRSPKRLAIRPTQDRIKQVIFSSLGDWIVGKRVLDLYAGTGALGIEALSRGAAACVLVEQAPEAVAVIRANLDHCGLTGQVVRGDALRFLQAGPGATGTFDLVLADPPYEKIRGELEGHSLLAAVRPWLPAGGRFVWEHYGGMSWKTDANPDGGWRLWRHRRYGETGLSTLEATEKPLA